jgi:hypothetical protein
VPGSTSIRVYVRKCSTDLAVVLLQRHYVATSTEAEKNVH